MSDFFETRERLRARYSIPWPGVILDAHGEALDGGFLAEVAGRVILTAPASTITMASELPRELAERWEQAAQGNSYMLWLQGRFVEAEKANRNGAFWSTQDLQFGEMSVRHGPLNWLHEEQTIIGTIADNALIHPEAQGLAQVAAYDGPADRYLIGDQWVDAELVARADAEHVARAAKTFPLNATNTTNPMSMSSPGKAPEAMPVITTPQELLRAIQQCTDCGSPVDMQKHIMKHAKTMGLGHLIPDHWTKGTASLLDEPVQRPYIAAVSAVWKWVHPEKAKAIERCAEAGNLYYSMECIAREMSCQSDETHTGCGASFDYVTAMTQPDKVCEHIAGRTSARRMVDPAFLGGAVIVPPTQPGWGAANVEVVKQAASLAEQTSASSGSMSDAQWEALMRQVVRYATT